MEAVNYRTEIMLIRISKVAY